MDNNKKKLTLSLNNSDKKQNKDWVDSGRTQNPKNERNSFLKNRNGIDSVSSVSLDEDGNLPSNIPIDKVTKESEEIINHTPVEKLPSTTVFPGVDYGYLQSPPFNEEGTYKPPSSIYDRFKKPIVKIIKKYIPADRHNEMVSISYKRFNELPNWKYKNYNQYMMCIIRVTISENMHLLDTHSNLFRTWDTFQVDIARDRVISDPSKKGMPTIEAYLNHILK